MCIDRTEGKRISMKCPSPWDAQGFTLVELMIALFISMLVAAALATAYQTNQRVKTAQDQVVEMQQNLRGAFFLLQRELRMAGLDRMETADAGILAATRNGITFTQDFMDPTVVPQVNDPPGDGKISVADETVRFSLLPVEDDVDNDGVADNGKTYLRKYNANDLAGSKFDTPIIPGTSADRVKFDNRTIIIDNLAALEFCYRTEKMAATDPCTTAPDAGELDRIRAVTVSMLMRAADPDPKFNSGGQTFQTGSGQQWVTPNDRYRRQLLVSTIQLRNMGL